MAKIGLIREVAIADLVPYERNAKTHSQEQVEKIANSIKEFGFLNPCLIDKDNNLIAGHGRVEACKLLGWQTVPCLPVEGLTEAQRRAYILADNRLTELGGWDMELVNAELTALQDMDFDIDLTGFEIELEEPQEVQEDDFDVDAPIEPVAKLGDVWQLGKHRLMCGDSTSATDIDKLMNGLKADMVFTDPPYGVSASGGRSQTKDKLKMKDIANDDLRNDDLVGFLSDFISVMQYKDGASIYICYPWATQKEFTEAIQNNGLKIKNYIIWDKKVFGLNGFKGYRPQYEMIYFCCKNDFSWYGDLSQSNIWYISREIKRAEQGNHPTPKPIELIAKALQNSSKQDDIVLDVFGGSGSTLIACEQMNRKCYMMELDPHYVDVIINRWETLTGKKAKLINK